MAAGAKTVLISRWRTGGETPFELVREFSQEMSHTPPSAAWRRSVLLARERPLDLSAEPRVEDVKDLQSSPTAAHPFFWAGYLLADTGTPLQAPAVALPDADADPGD
jgi:CHAT domain-containing protein